MYLSDVQSNSEYFNYLNQLKFIQHFNGKTEILYIHNTVDNWDI